MMNTAVIGIGSNISPNKNIARARKTLQGKLNVLAESDFVRTKPVGYTDQADFINGAVLVEAELSFDQLQSLLKTIEKDMGRKKSDIPSGPRSIDMDIVVFNDRVVDQDFYERDFLKRSVLDLLPALKY